MALAATTAQEQAQVARDAGPGMPSCIVYDEDLAFQTLLANDPSAAMIFGESGIILNETDAFARQDDKGPYHWAQGPQDVTPVRVTPPPITPPVNPSPNPEPVTPGQLPRKGQAVTTTNLRLRKQAGVKNPSLGVIPTGTTVLMTGGRRKVEKSLWVRVKVDASEVQTTRLKGADTWLAPPKTGWVNSEYLAVPASEYVAQDFPPITHEFCWYLEDAGGLNAEDVKRTLTAITDDPRGPLRIGLDLREVATPQEAHVLVRMVDDACGGAAGCYYKRSGERARVDIAKRWFNTQWLSRVWLHEAVGHAATRAYDHYDNAPQYPRPEYSGLMGNWQDRHGDHAWPDQDDVDNMIEWLKGASPHVYVRDLPRG
jgi:hypothetical protein